MAIGLNCALGASDMKQYIANLSACADCFVFCYPNAGLPNAMGGYDQKGVEMAEEVRPFFEEGLVNAVGGCCGTTPEHIAAIRAVASTFPPRATHPVEPLLRISGLEPFNYTPDASNMRRTFIKIGERCNVAGSIAFKKSIVDGDYDTALAIALKQVTAAQPCHSIGFGDAAKESGSLSVALAGFYKGGHVLARQSLLPNDWLGIQEADSFVGQIVRQPATSLHHSSAGWKWSIACLAGLRPNLDSPC
jgi:hypothetical protein